MSQRLTFPRKRSLLIFAAAVTALAVLMFFALSHRAAHADDDLACRADVDTNLQIDRDEAVSAITNYLFSTDNWTRDEAVDAVLAYLTERILTCDETQ